MGDYLWPRLVEDEMGRQPKGTDRPREGGGGQKSQNKKAGTIYFSGCIEYCPK